MFGLQMVNEIESFQREIDQLLRGCSVKPHVKNAQKNYQLAVREGEAGYHIETPLPGIDLEKLEISVLGRHLTISGELAVPEVTGEATWHRQERRIGPFRHRVLLPIDVDNDKVEAEYKNGILRINLEKSAAMLPKKINVNAA